MNIKDVLAVSGLPGLYTLVNTRDNGLFVVSLDGGKTKFCSTRKHNFTPLETVAIYTFSDTVELKEVFDSIHTSTEEIPGKKDSKAVHEAYFEKILPEYDRDRVHFSDMKKIIKWYTILDEKGLIDAPEPVSDEEE